jgi:hypothetical protein
MPKPVPFMLKPVPFMLKAVPFGAASFDIHAFDQPVADAVGMMDD